MTDVVEPEYTDEQIKTRQKQLEFYCDKTLPLLRKQAELVELQFKVDSFILNRKMVRAKLAEMEVPPEDVNKTTK